VEEQGYYFGQNNKDEKAAQQTGRFFYRNSLKNKIISR